MRAILNLIRKILAGLVGGIFAVGAAPFNFFGRMFSGGGGSADGQAAEAVAQRAARDAVGRTMAPTPDLDSVGEVKRIAAKLARGHTIGVPKLSSSALSALMSMPKDGLVQLSKAPDQAVAEAIQCLVTAAKAAPAPVDLPQAQVIQISDRIAALRAKKPEPLSPEEMIAAEIKRNRAAYGG